MKGGRGGGRGEYDQFFLRDIKKIVSKSLQYFVPIRWVPKLFFKNSYFIVEICILMGVF